MQSTATDTARRVPLSNTQSFSERRCSTLTRYLRDRLHDRWPVQLLLFLSAGYILFGMNTAVVLSAPASTLPYLNSFVIAAMVVITSHLLLVLAFPQSLCLLLLVEDAVLVSLLLV